ncbi:MAG: hypothetical protein M1823_002261 [Watsoniomyces obsoletus]|nr:MAG: hypothetical protein M1823_002261 [Watsoniomyces obsoletus]
MSASMATDGSTSAVVRDWAESVGDEDGMIQGQTKTEDGDVFTTGPMQQDKASDSLTGVGTTSMKKPKKKKSKKSKRPLPPTMRPFSPASTVATEEDSDQSNASGSILTFPRLKKLPSAGSSSPLMRPSSACSQGGITAMRQQLEALNLKTGGSDTPGTMRTTSNLGTLTPSRSADASSDIPSEGERTPMTTYEVPLEQGFVSVDVPTSSNAIMTTTTTTTMLDTGETRQDSILRKMSAADFEPLRCLGKGTYGTVLLVRHRSTGRLYAQKQFRKASLTVHKKLIEQTKTERTILESVNRHAFVVKLYYAFQDHEKLYLILEYAQGGELFTHLAIERMFSEDVAAFYMAEMVLALEHLHRTVGVVYRDLKPENCLLDAEGHLLLTDFGLSKVAVDQDDESGDCCRSILGTVEYMAPEVVQGKPYGTAVDWWSLGALGFDLMTGSPPFQGGNHAKIQERIVKQKLFLPYYLSPDAKDLLTRLLRKDPKKRLGGGGGGGRGNGKKDLQIIKSHRFFRKINWSNLAKRECQAPIKPLITDPSLAENFAVEFTDLALSPVFTRFAAAGQLTMMGEKNFGQLEDPLLMEYCADEENNPFGGFSYVASSSLLDGGNWAF